MKTGTILVLLFQILFFLSAFATETRDNGVLIVSAGLESAPAHSSEPIPQNLNLLYDAAELPVAELDKSARAALLESVPLQYRIHVEDFSLDELNVFLQKKKAYLDQFISFLKKAKFSQERIEKMVPGLDAQFYESSRLLLHVNSTGGQHKFLIRTGLSLNVEFFKKFKIGKTKLVQYLSNKKGYFYLFAGGWGLSRIVDPKTKKTHLILDLMVTKENFKSVSTLIAEVVTLDLAVFGLSMDVRKGNFNSIVFDSSKIAQTATYMGPAGRKVRTSSQLSWEFPVSIPLVTSISVPPLTSGLAFLESDVTVYRHSLNLSQLNPKQIAAKIWDLISNRTEKKLTCSAYYASF